MHLRAITPAANSKDQKFSNRNPRPLSVRHGCAADRHILLTQTSNSSTGYRTALVGVEPASGHCRTGLRITETEIGKTRAETCAPTSPAWHLLGEFSQPETRVYLPN